MSSTHELKTWPSPFQAIIDGNKRHEIRKNDRGFRFGDVLHLREWHPGATGLLVGDPQPIPPHYTGRETVVRITFISEGGTWGLPADLCVMSIAPCCTCTHEAGDTWPCAAHPGCSECGAETSAPVEQCKACKAEEAVTLGRA